MKLISAVTLYIILICSVFLPSSPSQEQQVKKVLTLSECLLMAVQNNPALKAYSSEIRAQDGLVEQSKLKPNPQLNVEAENLLGSGEYRFFKGAETTVSFSQLIETADKRAKKIHTAQLEKEKAQLDYDNIRLDVMVETADAFIAVLAIQERMQLEKEFYRISQQVVEISKANVEAGRVSPIEQNRAKVIADSIQIELHRAERELETAKLSLTAQWDSQEIESLHIAGDIMTIPPVPDFDAALNQMEANPSLQLASHEIQIKKSALLLEKANAIPDIEAGAGLRYLSDAEDAAFVVSFSMPLPIANRNQGAIRAAGEWVRKAEEEKNAKVTAFHNSLRQLFLTLKQSDEEIQQVKNRILPEVQKSFELIQEGYRLGKFSYISVLDAQRDLFDRKKDLLAAVQEYYKTFNRLQRLIANSGSNALTN